MGTKNILFDALEHKKTERTPWVPYTGIQIGSLKEYSATELLQDRNKMIECLLDAEFFYTPDGMPVIFDLQVEAEIFGAQLMWAEKAPPSVASHPLESTKDIVLKMPEKSEGRLPLILDVMHEMTRKIGSRTGLYGLLTGPFTLASHLRGMNLFMDMLEDEEYVKRLIAFCTDTAKTMAKYYIDAGMEIIAVVDPLISQIAPDSFSTLLAESYTEIFDEIRMQNAFSSLFVCGDATHSIKVMAKTKPDCLSIDENVDIIAAKEITDKHNVVISGNIPLTTVMLLGSQQDNQKYALDLLEKAGDKNFILAPGCDMPYDTSKDNIIGVAQAVQNPEATKTMLRHYVAKEIEIEITLPDYDNLMKPLIEVFTVDSATCAACGYMKEAAFEMKDIFETSIDVVEYKITEPENVARINKLGIKNLPAMLINGELAFSSLIPDRKTLRNRVASKLQ